jgi:hypothetical protein
MPHGQDKESAAFYAYKGYVNRQGLNTRGIETISDHKSLHTAGAAHILAVQRANVVIVVGGTEASYNAAITAAELRRRIILIPGFGGAARAVLKLYPRHVYAEISPHRYWMRSSDWVAHFAVDLKRSLLSYPRVLIIHGRSRDRHIVKQILSEMNLPGIDDAVIMEEQGEGSPNILNLFEWLARQVDAAIAVATPDDIATEVIDEKGELITSHRRQRQYRARQNVWLEVGWFWGMLGFDKILVLVKGHLEIPSNVSGVRFVRYDISPRNVEPIIRNFIENLRYGS